MTPENLTEGDRAIVREIAREVAEEFTDNILDAVQKMIRVHQAECPGATLPGRMKLFLIGIALGSGGLGFGIGFQLMRWF